MITINITSPRQIAGITAAATAVGDSPEVYIQRIVESAAESYRDHFFVDRITASDFILRFTDEERVSITASTDELVVGFMNRVKAEPYVWLASTEVESGMEYLVLQGFITQERSDIITDYSPSPSEPIVDTVDETPIIDPINESNTVNEDPVIDPVEPEPVPEEPIG